MSYHEGAGKSSSPFFNLCPHFGKCGGCRTQDLPYAEQLAQKEVYLADIFEKWKQAERFPIIPCASPWNYRNKMEFSFSQDLKGNRYLGLMQRGKRGRVENLTTCLLTRSWFSELLEQVRAWWEGRPLSAYHPPSDRGMLRMLTVREGMQTGERLVALTVSGNPAYPLSPEDEESFTKALSSLTDNVVVRRQIIQKKVPTRFEEKVVAGRGYLFERLGSFRFKVGVSSFFQPNTLQAERLYERAFELAQLSSHSHIYDLYCGTGAIGILASAHVSHILGIESNAEAVSDAHENIALNGIKNMEVVCGDVGKLLGSYPAPDLAIVDPPRAGLSDEAVGHLLRLSPSKILYISCNPLTQAANCTLLTQQDYILKTIQPVDQFPHTPHLENIVVLEKKI